MCVRVCVCEHTCGCFFLREGLGVEVERDLPEAGSLIQDASRRRRVVKNVDF